MPDKESEKKSEPAAENNAAVSEDEEDLFWQALTDAFKIEQIIAFYSFKLKFIKPK